MSAMVFLMGQVSGGTDVQGANVGPHGRGQGRRMPGDRTPYQFHGRRRRHPPIAVKRSSTEVHSVVITTELHRRM